MTDLPERARAVIVGGGVSGCSVAYHLARLGWRDVVLLERMQLTCGTTWHAAGLVGQLRSSQNMTRLAKYSADLYVKLDGEETGVATGMRQNGSITVALTGDRKEEIYRSASLARAFGVDVNEVSAGEVKELYPWLNVSDVVGAVHLPLDGQCDPANIAQALGRRSTPARREDRRRRESDGRPPEARTGDRGFLGVRDGRGPYRQRHRGELCGHVGA